MSNHIYSHRNSRSQYDMNTNDICLPPNTGKTLELHRLIELYVLSKSALFTLESLATLLLAIEMNNQNKNK